LNLIGGSRLVMFDLDWNPATDKQAAARCWRDGQRYQCYTYRFVSSGTLEERMLQRQLSKEGLQNIIEDKDQVRASAWFPTGSELQHWEDGVVAMPSHRDAVDVAVREWFRDAVVRRRSTPSRPMT
jgi:hypothetical protein